MTKTSYPTVFPNLQYKDCQLAIKWLETVLGFTKQMIAMGDDGKVQHSELRFGNGYVMVSSTDDRGLNWQGEEPGHFDIALAVENKKKAREIYDKVKEHGAKIVKDFQYSDFGKYGGSHGFTCADPEGNRWSIGTYQPSERRA